MSSTSTKTTTHTYTTVDIENVIRRFTTDIMMIADSTKAITREHAKAYGHDIEVWAQRGFLKWVDVTLFDGSTEIKAVRYNVVTSSGDLAADKPGGVLWPKIENAHVRVFIQPTSEYFNADRSVFESKLELTWSDSSADINHSTLTAGGGRGYSSNGYGLTREDYQ
jgi:hypothetical protein